MKTRNGQTLKTALLIEALKNQPMRYTDMQRFLYAAGNPNDLEFKEFSRGHYCTVIHHIIKNVLYKRKDGRYVISSLATPAALQNPTAWPWSRNSFRPLRFNANI